MSLIAILTALNSGNDTTTAQSFQIGTVKDDGYYNGFLFMSDVINGACYGIYKKSANHAACGPLTFVKTTDYGATWTENTVTVNGSTVSSTNHSFLRLSSGRILISYRDSGTMYFAYCDSNNHVFTSTGSPIPSLTDLAVAQSPVKMVETSYGTILFVYYLVGTNGNSAKGIIMESSDNGLTWTQKSTIFDHNTQCPASPYTDWRANETAICETHPTGNETTSKWIAVSRVELPDDGGTYYMKFNSSDGGNTWAQDTTSDSGSFVNDNGTTVASDTFSRGLVYAFLESNSPVDIRLHNGLVYLVNGERSITYGYALKYTTATPDGAFRNKFDDWARPTFVKFYNAETNGSFLDCGYPLFFKDDVGSLFVSDYDTSLLAIDTSKATRRCLVETVQITGLP